MPTYERDPRFVRDFARLSREEKQAFRTAVAPFLQDLPSRRFRVGLRVRDVEGAPGVWEMTWAIDGRATFPYGPEVHAGESYIIWRRVGSHDIFAHP